MCEHIPQHSKQEVSKSHVVGTRGVKWTYDFQVPLESCWRMRMKGDEMKDILEHPQQ